MQTINLTAVQQAERSSERPCCTDRLVNAPSPPNAFSLGDANGLRVSKLKHPVQGVNGDGDLCPATLIRPRAQGPINAADHREFGAVRPATLKSLPR